MRWLTQKRISVGRTPVLPHGFPSLPRSGIAGRELGFQVLMISHHEVEIFEKYADKVYRVAPMMGGVVQVREVGKRAAEEDRN